MKIVSYDKALSELKKWKIDETEYQNFSEQLSSFLKVLKDNKASGARENKYQIDICKFLSDTFYKGETNPVLLIDLGSGVFDNATVDSSILVYQKAVYEKHTISCKASKSDIDALDEYIADNSYDISFEQNQNWIIASPIESSIRTKVESLGTPLSEWNVDINYGIKTGANDVFIIDEDTRNKLVSEDPKCDEIIRPILRGRDIKRFGYNYQHLYLICTFPAKKYSIDDYPSVKNYLLSFGIERLEQTGKTQFVNGVKIISRKKTSNKWFETQDNINYSDNFYKQKIIYSEIVQSPKFHLDNEFFYPEASTFIITGENLYSLIAFLNSKIYSSIYKLFYAGGGLGDSGFRYKKNFLETLPLVYPTIENEAFFKNLVNKIYEGDRFADEQIENKIQQLLGLTHDEKKYLLDI